MPNNIASENYCVYCHQNLINGKRYIGKTNNTAKRWGYNGREYVQKRTGLKNTVFANAIKKYGWNSFSHTILEEGLTDAKASERESYYIGYYKTNICRYGPDYGYNMTDGGEGVSGRKISEETRAKMRDSHIGKVVSDETKQKISNSSKGHDRLSPEVHREIGRKNSVLLRGRKLSAEHIEHIREASKKRGLSALARENSAKASRKRIVCVETGEVFNSMKEACLVYGFSATHLSAVCCGRRQTAAGMHWNYIGQEAQ